MRPSWSFKLVADSNSGTQGIQQPQKTQNCIFAMNVDEAQANPDTVTSTMFIFGTPIRVLFDYRSSRSFVSTPFALHVDRELASLKNKLVVTTSLEE